MISLFAYVLLFFGFIPIIAYAKPQYQMRENFTEYVINNMLIGKDFTKIPLPIEHLYDTADTPTNEVCNSIGSQSKKSCAYKASDGLIYEIMGAKITSIEMLKNKNGDWPKQLPFGIKSSDNNEQIVKTLSELHLIPLSGHLNENQKQHPYVMYETRAPQYLEVWFGFDANNQIERMMIMSQQPE
ncbi:MAG: hypothetical protein J0L55_09545 [Caulobacterales bacterium]|nr:hypothetical protein [Caulobacterales bacterium]